jgi:hypothetical protein
MAAIRRGFMALRFCIDGSITVDTVAEALDFERGRSTQINKPKFNARSKPPPSKAVDPNTAGTWEGFMQLMEARNAGRMRKVLALVKGRHPGMMALRELQKLMGDDTSQRKLFFRRVHGSSGPGLPA